MQPDGEHLLILLHIVAADKPDHRIVRGYDSVDRDFGLLALGINNGFVMRNCAVNRTTVKE